MSLKTAITLLSENEYLAWEVQQEIRHEYIAGYTFAMAGTKRAHNQIAMNLIAAIRPLLRGSDCRIYASDVKLKVSSKQAYFYPDMMLGCDKDDVNDYFLENPSLLAEILSDSTEQIDKREKLLIYQSIHSVKEYVLIAQDKVWVQVYRFHQSDSFLVETYTDLQESVYFSTFDQAIGLAVIYEDVRFF
jgi:Uma2 family endonuclease